MKVISYMILFLSVLISISCEKSKDTVPECNFENPLEELTWLNDVKTSLTDCSCQVSILQGIYKEQTVFYLMVTDPLCNSVFHVVLWDCNGDFVREYKPGENDLFFNMVELVDNIYTCSDNG